MKHTFALAVLIATISAASSAQPRWQQRTGTAPPPRFITAMAHDPVRGRTVMFGGRDGTTFYGDTWEWDGSTWTQKQPLVSPGPRQGHAMVYDSVRRRIVLVGGLIVGRIDTWEWDGVIWQQIPTPAAPPAREQFAMAYDEARSKTVLFSGVGQTNDTWEYDGTTWVQKQPATSPPARCCAAMACDAVRQRLVLFGGYDNTALRDDTWEWDGTTWVQKFPTTRPPVRCCNGMTFDPGRGRILLFGGASGVGTGDRNDVWEWDGGNWVERNPPASPPARRGSGFAFVPGGAHALMFGGGIGGGGSPTRGDTWGFAAGRGPSFVRFGTGCVGSAGMPALAARAGVYPWTGGTYTLDLTSLPATGAAFGILGTSKSTWGPVSLPLLLDFVGMPGCNLLVSLDVALPLTNQNGGAAWALPVPDDPSLHDAQLWLQGGVLDPAANALGVVLSGAGELTIAVR